MGLRGAVIRDGIELEFLLGAPVGEQGFGYQGPGDT